MAHLAGLPGLHKIISVNATGVPMCGKTEAQPGIPECFYLVNELEKCKAGGLPPPLTIPDEAETKRREEQAKQAREAKEAQEAAERKAAAEIQKEVDDLEMKADVFMGTPSGCSANPPNTDAEIAMKTVRDAHMKKLHFADTPDELVKAATGALQDASRVVILVDGQTTEKEMFGSYLDAAKQLWDVYTTGTGSGGADAQTKFRIVVMLGSRWDLLDKVCVAGRSDLSISP